MPVCPTAEIRECYFRAATIEKVLWNIGATDPMGNPDPDRFPTTASRLFIFERTFAERAMSEKKMDVTDVRNVLGDLITESGKAAHLVRNIASETGSTATRMALEVVADRLTKATQAANDKGFKN